MIRKADSQIPYQPLEPTMPSNSRGSHVSATTFFNLATFALVLGFLFLARTVVLPLAMAILLTALLAPLVRRLEGWRIPRVPAVIVVTALISLVLFGLGATLGNQIVNLGGELTKYRSELTSKFSTIRDSLRLSPQVQESMEVLEGLSESAIDSPADEASGNPPPKAEANSPLKNPPSAAPGATVEPVPVRIVGGQESPLSGAREVLGLLMEPLGVAAMVFVLTVFMLIAREDLRNRMLVLIGGDRVPGTTQLLEEAWQRVSRYLRMQLLINSLYGLAVGGMAFAAGLPNALLFGLQATVFRFVPYLGPIVAAGLPLAVTLAVTQGWNTFLAMAAGLLILELVVNNVLEPWLYGSSTGVSAVGILVSAFFWTWLWGAVGLVLATPLTVCLVVLGRHVPALRFWATLLSEESPLGPTERLYQRLLARDAFESFRIIDETRQEHKATPVPAICGLLSGAVTNAAIDHGLGEIDDERLQAFTKSFHHVWQEVMDDFDLPSHDELHQQGALQALLLPARGVCDREASRIAAAYLTHEGWHATVAEPQLLVSDLAKQAVDGAMDVCVITAIGERAAAHARYICRQLIMSGWHGPTAVLAMPGEHLTASALERLTAAGVAEVVGTHAELAAKLSTLTERARVERDVAAAENSENEKVHPTPASTT